MTDTLKTDCLTLRRFCDADASIVAAAWGRRLATQTAAATPNRHFSQDDEPVSAVHVLDNPCSGKVLKKLGFRNSESRNEFSGAAARTVRFRDMVLTGRDCGAST